jgi:multicomponent Na+:H+ antiporter subunit B
VTPALRRNVFLGSIVVLAPFLAWGAWLLPGFGRYPGPYGDVINRIGVPQRHATDLVSAVNLDYRGFDTIGEEFILFTASLGVMVLLRSLRGEGKRPSEGADPERERPGTTDLIRAAGTALGGPVALLGVYVLSHGQLTPGGGFQGGLVLASAPFLVYLAGRRLSLRRLPPLATLEVAEAIGAGGFVAVGMAGLAVGAAFLENVAPLGATGQLDSSGTIAIINALVALEVAAAFVLVLSEFLEQALIMRGGPRQEPEGEASET